TIAFASKRSIARLAPTTIPLYNSAVKAFARRVTSWVFSAPNKPC
ncbi:hypothetical protein PSYJA_43486, partial [Pseudomonas syringae pv. japonica str. M301072]